MHHVTSLLAMHMSARASGNQSASANSLLVVVQRAYSLREYNKTIMGERMDGKIGDGLDGTVSCNQPARIYHGKR